jgi:hypothetical protein
MGQKAHALCHALENCGSPLASAWSQPYHYTAPGLMGMTGKMKLSQNYDPTRDRATITRASPNWVAPTSYVGVAQRQEVCSGGHTVFGFIDGQASKRINLLCLRHRDV